MRASWTTAFFSGSHNFANSRGQPCDEDDHRVPRQARAWLPRSRTGSSHYPESFPSPGGRDVSATQRTEERKGPVPCNANAQNTHSPQEFGIILPTNDFAEPSSSKIIEGKIIKQTSIILPHIILLSRRFQLASAPSVRQPFQADPLSPLALKRGRPVSLERLTYVNPRCTTTFH
jgi:hypothetical protein